MSKELLHKQAFSFLPLLAVFVVVIALLLNVYVSTASASAADTVSFEYTDVMEDLKSMEGFDINSYPAKSSGELKPMYFVEYGYTFRANERSHYGLYIYVYNPAQLNIDVNSAKNRIKIAVAFNDQGRASDYDYFGLRLCSFSTDKLFYKFRINDKTGSDGKTILERVNAEARRYDVAELELLTSGNNHASAYTVGVSFIYSGYAQGCGQNADADSTLTCKTEELETIALQTHASSYKFQNDVEVWKQVSSVYFSVPEEYFDYGVLQKIKAEWNEYVTKPIIVTSSSELYNALLPWVGVEIGQRTDDLSYFVFQNYLPYDCFPWEYAVTEWGYNAQPYMLDSSYEYLSKLVYLFYTNGQSIDDYYLSGKEIGDYIRDYPVFEDLFETDIEQSRKDEGYQKGYNVRVIDAGDTFDLLKYDWHKDFYSWYARVLYDLEEESITGISPIEEISSSVLSLSDEELSRKLLVDIHDIPALRSFCSEERAAGRIPYLFRFAVSDCSSIDLYWDKVTSIDMDHKRKNQVYKFQETVFLDFDIIWLGFCKDGKLTIIPAVSAPIDVIGSAEAPKNTRIEDLWDNWKDKLKDFWSNLSATLKKILKIILIVLAAIVGLFVVILIVKLISSFVRWILLIKASRRRDKQDYHRKE